MVDDPLGKVGVVFAEVLHLFVETVGVALLEDQPPEDSTESEALDEVDHRDLCFLPSSAASMSGLSANAARTGQHQKNSKHLADTLLSFNQSVVT